MFIENSKIIIILLLAIMVVLIYVIMTLNIQFYKQKRKFNKKVRVLEEVIVQLSKDKSGKQNQIRHSEELESKLKTIYNSLGTDIFDLNKDLFEILSKNNLA